MADTRLHVPWSMPKDALQARLVHSLRELTGFVDDLPVDDGASAPGRRIG